MARRTLSWSSALSALRADRATPKEICEVRLRTYCGVRGSTGIALSAWRGRLGSRYVVGIHALTADAANDVLSTSPAILIAVHRNEAGFSDEPVEVTAFDAGNPDIAEWIEQARAWGANELHVHRFAETADERTAVVSDLTSDALAARHAAIAECRAGFAALMAEVA